MKTKRVRRAERLSAAERVAARWKDGHLLMPGLAPLSLPSIAAKAHARNDVTGAMAHAFSRWGWSRAIFPIAGQTWSADIDALAVRKGGGNTRASIAPA